MARRESNEVSRSIATMPNLHSLIATVSELLFVPEYSAPQDRLFTFQYRVTIKNNYSKPINVTRRYWEINDSGKNIRVDAITVGGTILPRLGPGEAFTYVTAVPFHAPGGTMNGRFFAQVVGGGELSASVDDFAFRVSKIQLERCSNNRATPPEFVSNTSPLELLSIQNAISEYRSKCQNSKAVAEINTSALNLSDDTRHRFERLLLTMFFGEYEKLDRDGNPQSTLSLSNIHRSFLDIAISDLYMLRSSNGFSITIKHAVNVSRLLHWHHLAKERGGEVNDLPRRERVYLYDLLNAILKEEGVPEGERPALIKEFRIAIARVTRPKWRGRLRRGGDLATLTAPLFLKKVLGDFIEQDGTADSKVIKAIDAELMRAVGLYISQRAFREIDMGDAKGLKWITRPYRSKSELSKKKHKGLKA